MSTGAILALYAGTTMFTTLMTALNAAYEVHDTRPWWKQELIAMAVMIGSVIGMSLATLLFMGGEQLLDSVARALGLGEVGIVGTGIVQYVLAFVLLTGSIWTMYMVLPDVKKQNKLQSLVGAVFAAALWMILTTLFRLYVTNYSSYNKTYGTVGAVIILLTWMYWSVFTVLAGGELNSELRRGTGTAALKSQGLSATSGLESRVATHEGGAQPSTQLG